MITIGFFGTPELASCILDTFLKNENFTVAYVVTNPDAPHGRKQILTETPVKKRAKEANIPIFTPEKIRNNTEFLKEISRFSVDYIVVVAYGKILPREILDIPKNMCINIHFSLLPKYRGASPIQSALLHGEKETGFTVMQMNEKMDEGDIIFQERMKIAEGETSQTLFEKFCHTSGEIVTDVVEKLHIGILHPIPQDHAEATYTGKIEKSDGEIDWTENAENIYHRWQAFSPWPGIFTYLDGKRLLLAEIEHTSQTVDFPPGTVISLGNEVGVSCGSGTIFIKKLKLEGKTLQTPEEFIHGQKDFIGKVLG